LQWQFFACMKHTLHKSQVHSYSVMQWWVSSSLMSPLPAEVACESRERIFYCWSSLRNNNMATNLQRFTLYSGSRRFVAWDCWTHASWQVMQRDSDTLMAVSHVHLYLEKEARASLQQCNHKFEKLIISASVTNVAECQTALMQASFHAV